MNNHEIASMMLLHPRTRLVFDGVYAADNLPRKPRDRKPCAYILNTAPSSSMGEHWVSAYFPPRGHPEYFDSFAMSVPDRFQRFLGNTFWKSNVPVQNVLTTACGQFCIFFICMRYIYQRSMETIITYLSEQDGWRADEFVNMFVERFFSVDLEVQDTDFIMEQFSAKP